LKGDSLQKSGKASKVPLLTAREKKRIPAANQRRKDAGELKKQSVRNID